MANPTVRRSANRDRRSKQQEKLQPLPLITRRFAAWTAEVSLIVMSGLVPFGIGVYVQSEPTGEQVSLNPVVAVTEEAIARTLALPMADNNRQVTPLTNLLWSAAIVAPVLLSGWQLYLLAKTGSTLPKRWFGVRVVTATGTVPGISRVLLREGVGAWGLPLAIAYLLWRYSSTFPNLGLLTALSGLMVLGEGMSARFDRQRRCLHDRLAGTYVIDANRPFTPFSTRSNSEGVQKIRQASADYGLKANEPIGVVPKTRHAHTAVMPRATKGWRGRWRWMRQHPSLTLLLVSLASLAAVLGTLVGTQVYIQTQKNQREFAQHKNEQFLSLLQQLSPNSRASLEDRQRAILALGTLDDPQALQLLVDLLSQETASGLIASIQQALVSVGPKALPDLQRLNQSLSNELESRRYTDTSQRQAVRTQQLQATQQAIAKILVIYSGKLHNIDLNRTNLGQTFTNAATFNLALDRVDLSGIMLRAANLNHGSFQGSKWRGVGEDGHWNTFDDAIADLSDAQMQAVNLAHANLSHVLMNRTNLIRANLNSANLSKASLNSANLSSTQMVGSDLRDAVLANASLTGADLAAANFSRANLSAARLSRVSASGAKLQLANLTKSVWQGADLSGADLNHANLSHADLSVTRLTSTNLRDAQLQNANLRNADLRLADLRGADLAGADLQGATFVSSQQEQPNQFIQTPADSSLSALVAGVDFSQVKNLDVKQLAYICTHSGRHPRCP